MEVEVGCVIDCSHLSSVELNYRIIFFAANLGWDGGAYDLNLIDSDWLTYVNGDIPAEFISEFDFQEALYFAADDAVQWLNDNIATDDRWFDVYDNSLYYSEDESENV